MTTTKRLPTHLLMFGIKSLPFFWLSSVHLTSTRSLFDERGLEALSRCQWPLLAAQSSTIVAWSAVLASMVYELSGSLLK